MILGRNLNHLAWSRFFMRIRSWNTFRESNTLGLYYLFTYYRYFTRGFAWKIYRRIYRKNVTNDSSAYLHKKDI